MEWCNTTDFIVGTMIVTAIVMASCSIAPPMIMWDKGEDEKARSVVYSAALLAAAFVVGLASSITADVSVLWGCG